jgi:hypothetical protein
MDSPFDFNRYKEMTTPVVPVAILAQPHEILYKFTNSLRHHIDRIEQTDLIHTTEPPYKQSVMSLGFQLKDDEMSEICGTPENRDVFVQILKDWGFQHFDVQLTAVCGDQMKHKYIKRNKYYNSVSDLASSVRDMRQRPKGSSALCVFTCLACEDATMTVGQLQIRNFNFHVTMDFAAKSVSFGKVWWKKRWY